MRCCVPIRFFSAQIHFFLYRKYILLFVVTTNFFSRIFFGLVKVFFNFTPILSFFFLFKFFLFGQVFFSRFIEIKTYESN